MRLPYRCAKCYLLAPVTDVFRSPCLTKYYCSSTCLEDDENNHKICCNSFLNGICSRCKTDCSEEDKNNPNACYNKFLNAQRRKWRKNSRERVEAANHVLQNYVKNQQHIIGAEKELLEKVVSKLEPIKLWYDDETLPKLPEVD